MSGTLEKAISRLIQALSDTALWLCAVAMAYQGTYPKHGVAGWLFYTAVIIGLVWIFFDVWRWFANRRAA